MKKKVNYTVEFKVKACELVLKVDSELSYALFALEIKC